ncbi:MAG: hypothetical protein FWC41_01460 [Firmicutes bacterium]|nr:hypothetical protein [Bacillota bacterium]
MLREELKSITVDDLLNKNEISVRARKFCNNSNINSLFDIFDSYEKGRLFYEFKKAGTQTCLELQELCKKYAVQLTINNFRPSKQDLQKEQNDLDEMITNAFKYNKFENQFDNILIKYKNYLPNINSTNASENVEINNNNIVKQAQFLQKNKLKKIKINQLRDKNLLSERAANYCVTKGLDNLFKIISYYEKKGNFLKRDIIYSGRNICIELDNFCSNLDSNASIIELCENNNSKINKSNLDESVDSNINSEEQPQNLKQRNELIKIRELFTTLELQENDNILQAKRKMLKDDLRNISLDDLIDSFQISIRTRNCCQYADLNSLFDIITCYENYGILYFKNLKGAGRRTYLELENLCVDTLSMINVKVNKNYAPQRKYFRCEEVLNIIEELTEQERIVLFSLANTIFFSETQIREKIKIYGISNLQSFAIDFFEKQGHLPIFWILEQWITDSKNFRTDILLNSFKFFNDTQILSLEQLASQYSKNRETIRKIRNDFFEEVFSFDNELPLIKGKRLNFLKISEIFEKISKDDFKYLLSDLKDFKVINQKSSEIHSLLKKEKCNFSIEFVLQIIAYIFPNNFVLFGGFSVWENIYRKKTWVNIFLINKELTVIFDFEKMREDFSSLLNNNDTEYFLDIESHILNSTCWINFDYTKNEMIAEVIKEILLFEFGLYPELDGNYKIPASKKCNPSDVVYKILLQNEKPMLLNEIFVEFKKIHPNHKYTEAAQLRPFLLKNEAITHRKRNSEYTLKEWEHIKTGTIRDAIVDFLDEKNTPQKAQDIFDYVIQHFPETNVSSIRTTMYSDSKKRFSFFENNLFGLSSKDYPQEYSKIDTVSKPKSFEERLNDFEQFIIDNDHFPYYSTNDKAEKSLCAWWNRVTRGVNQLNDSQQAEVKRVLIQYEHLIVDRKIHEWELNFNKLKIFLLENRRTPFATGEERSLYAWLRKIKEDFQNDNLSDDQRIKFIELAKLI